MKIIPVFYTDKMAANNQGGFSPSAYKPKQVVESWLDQELPIQIIQPQPVTIEQLCLAHDTLYVNGVLSLRLDNGFGTKSQAMADALHYTSGSMLSAARHVLEHGSVACSPTSGFHHACYQYGGGFCTFNGLMVIALALKQEGKVSRVGILDCDYHFGNGTIDIIQQLQIDWIKHYTNGGMYKATSKDDAYTFLKQVPKLIADLSDCDIILYQAGVDAHVDDPLGGFLTSDQMRERDLTVFKEAKSWNIPIAWNLAGGYQVELFPSGKTSIRKVLDLHDITMRQCIKTYLG